MVIILLAIIAAVLLFGRAVVLDILTTGFGLALILTAVVVMAAGARQAQPRNQKTAGSLTTGICVSVLLIVACLAVGHLLSPSPAAKPPGVVQVDGYTIGPPVR
jgi:hypothetical protein